MIHHCLNTFTKTREHLNNPLNAFYIRTARSILNLPNHNHEFKNNTEFKLYRNKMITGRLATIFLAVVASRGYSRSIFDGKL